jgi:TolA-binding protein
MELYPQAVAQYKKILDNFSDSPVLMWAKVGLAFSSFELADFKTSRQMAQELAEDTETPAKTRTAASLLAAHSLFNSKKYEDAVTKYEQFARQNPQAPESGDALFYAGQAYFQLEYYANAIDAWKKVITFYKKNEKAPEAAFLMGDTFFKAQKYEEAIAAFRLLEQWPEDINPHRKEVDIRVAQCYYNAKQDDKAIAAYTHFVEKYPDDPKVKDAMEGIQLSYYRKGATADAVKPLMEFVSKFPRSRLATDALYRVGEIYYQEKNMEQTIATFQQLMADYPESSVLPNAQYYIAVCYDGLGQKEKAVANYQAFIRNFPTHELTNDIRFRLGTALFNLEKYEDAIAVYQTIVDLAPKSDYAPNALFNIALCYKRIKRWNDAITAYTQYYKMFPTNPKAKDAIVAIATTYNEEKRYPSAIKIWQEMIDNKDFADQKAELMYSIGNAYMEMEDKDNACKALEAMRAITPKNDVYRLTALAKLGTVYEEMQKWGNSYVIYEDMSTSGAKPEWTAAAKARMGVLKSDHGPEVDAFLKGGAAATQGK